MGNVKVNKDKLIDFSNAQKLYNTYSPYKTNEDLRECLFNIFGRRFENENNPRELINHILTNSYPNEAIIKAGFINDILLKSSNHVTIFELNVGSSRADLCKINGESIAYEIKTDLDNTLRLDKQLNDYITVFEKIYLICSENKCEQMLNNIIPECGLYSYKKTRIGRYRFTKVKEAIPSERISSLRQLNIFTKRELSFHFNLDIKLAREDMYSDILEIYNKEQINNVFKLCIKLKYQNEWGFLKEHRKQIHDIDYQWFFKYKISPDIMYR